LNLPAGKIQDVFFWIAAITLAAVAFVYSGSGTSLSTFPIETVPMTFPRETVFFTISGLAIVFALLRGGGSLPASKRTGLCLLAAFAVWSILATFWAADVLSHSRRLIELVFFYGWAFALSVLIVPLNKARNMTMLLGFSGGVVSLAVAAGPWAIGMSSSAWPFGNPNAAGMFCAFVAVINSGLLLVSLKEHKPEDPQVILPAACLVLSLVGLTLTFSKGALVGLIVGEAALVWCFFPKWRKWVAIAAPVILAIGSIVYVVSSSDPLGETTSGFRVQAYKAAVKQIGGAPLGGRGLGSFYAYFPQYSLPDISGHPKMGDTVFHAHSSVLEIGTELGIVGMAIFIALTVYLGVIPLFRKAREDNERSRLEAIWLAGFLMISAHALVAVHFYWTETVLYYWTAVGMLLALRRKGKPVEMVKRGLPFLAVALVCLAGLWYVGVYRELLGRKYVAMREKQLKRVRQLDKKFEIDQRNANRTRSQSAIAQLRKTQTERFYLYSQIIAELNEELALVHDPRMRSDTYYQLGSAYYNVGGVFLHPTAPKSVFRQLAALPWQKMKRRYGEAMYFFETVIADAPGYVNTDFFIGKTFKAFRQNERQLHSPKEHNEFRKKEIEALGRYLRFNIRSKMSGGATKDLASALIEIGKFNEAAESIERWMKNNSKHALTGDLTLKLVNIYMRLGKHAEGIMAIKQHLENNPNSPKKNDLNKLRKVLSSRILQKKPSQRNVKPGKQ
jgi:O-antigen ligase